MSDTNQENSLESAMFSKLSGLKNMIMTKPSIDILSKDITTGPNGEELYSGEVRSSQTISTLTSMGYELVCDKVSVNDVLENTTLDAENPFELQVNPENNQQHLVEAVNNETGANCLELMTSHIGINDLYLQSHTTLPQGSDLNRHLMFPASSNNGDQLHTPPSIGGVPLEGLAADKQAFVIGLLKQIAPKSKNIQPLAKTEKKKKQQPPPPKKAADLTPLLNFKDRALMTQKSALLQTRTSSPYIQNLLKKKRMLHPDGDGVDHINTSSVAQTKLGFLLEINCFSPFEHPELGHFDSIGGFWYYILCDQNSMFRTLSGRPCKIAGEREQRKNGTDTVEGFKSIIAEATWVKVISNKEIMDYMVDCDLPFTCYYPVGQALIPEFTATSSWYSAILEEIRRVLIINSQVVSDYKAKVSQAQKDDMKQLHTEMTDSLNYPNFEFLETKNKSF